MHPFVDTNINGVITLLEACARNKVKTFFQVSTDEVYGSILSGSFLETDNFNPTNPYSASKASAEHFCNSFSNTYGLDVKISRSCNNYGPFQQLEKFIPKVINSILENERVPIYGDGKQSREWIHVEDNCKAILKILFDGKSGSVYNIGSNYHITNYELAILILKLMGKSLDQIEYVSDRPGHDFRYSLDSNKLRNELNWTTRVNFNDGILNTIEWYKSHKKGVI